MVSISLSILLVIIPLQSNAQQNQNYKLYLRNGVVIEGSLVGMDKEMVQIRKKGVTDNRINSIPVHAIFVFISPTGELLIQNLENRQEFIQKYMGDPSGLEDYLSSEDEVSTSTLIYYPQNTNNVWTIKLINGDEYSNMIITELNKETLNIILNGEFGIHLRQIEEIYLSGNSNSGDWSLKGGILGGLISGILGFAVTSSSGQENNESLGTLITVFMILSIYKGGKIAEGIPSSKNSSIINLKGKTITEKNRIIYNILLAEDTPGLK